MNGYAFLKGGDDCEIVKYIENFKKISFPKPPGPFQPNLAQSILGWRGFKFVQMKGYAFLKGEIIAK